MRSPLNSHSQTAHTSARLAPDLLQVGGILLSGVRIAAFGQPHHNVYEPHTKRQENEVREIRTAIIIAVLRRMCPDWTERVEDWADTYRKIAKTRDRLHQEIFGIAFDLARSPLFAPVRRPLFRQEILALREGVTVTAIYRRGISLLRPALAAAAFLFLVLSFALSKLPGALSLTSAFALLAFAWCVFPLWTFRYVFYRGNNCISESLQDFIMEHHLYRTEAGCGVPGAHADARRIVDSIRLRYTWCDRVLIVRAFRDNTWREAANELDALGLPAALQRPLGSKVMGTNHTDYRFYDCLVPSE